MPAHFEDLEIGRVVSLGEVMIDPDMVYGFSAAFAPGWNTDDGAPDALIYALWSRLDHAASADWPQLKRLGVDALRWMRNPPAGERLRGRLTIMGKDAVGATKGLVFAQHDLLDEEGRLVFSCLTRSLFACRP